MMNLATDQAPDLATLPPPACLPDRIRQFASQQPDHPAILEGDRTLSYGALDRWANRIARALLAEGVAAGERVGVLLDRSAGFVAAALGILRAGAAYVPLDPAHPSARIAFMIEDSGARVVVCTQAGRAGLPASVVAIELDSPVDLQSDLQSDFESDASSEAARQGGEAAYVIYTSGTTGSPKGVAISHRNLENLIEWHRQAFGIGARDCGMMLASVGFDAAVWELWPYLAGGATLRIPPAAILRDPPALRDWIVAQGITVGFVPTLLAEALVRLEWPGDTRLRYMLTGGDTLRQYPRAGLPFRLINNYGPAECTVVATSGEVVATPSGQALPGIGYPIAGVSIYLLDELREVAAGEPGEICIGGRGVGLGYLNQPELTAERFLLWRGGQRLYRSGDLGRWNEDGSLQFLGRLDGQVQIRGYRIELGEVEAALHRVAAIRACAVTAREYGSGDLRLTAYLVPGQDGQLSRQTLRQQLRALLPEYMVPTEFVRLEALPLSVHGKLDRQSLPAPTAANRIGAAEPSDQTSADAEPSPAESSPVDPSPVEAELMRILKKLLAIEQIDPEDNFFLLGGHSFIAAQVIARIRSRFGVELSLKTVFDHPTARAMAEQIEQRILAKLGADYGDSSGLESGHAPGCESATASGCESIAGSAAASGEPR